MLGGQKQQMSVLVLMCSVRRLQGKLPQEKIILRGPNFEMCGWKSLWCFQSHRGLVYHVLGGEEPIAMGPSHDEEARFPTSFVVFLTVAHMLSQRTVRDLGGGTFNLQRHFQEG